MKLKTGVFARNPSYVLCILAKQGFDTYNGEQVLALLGPPIPLCGDIPAGDSGLGTTFLGGGLNESEKLVESADLSRGAQLRSERIAAESTEDRKLDCDPLLSSFRNPGQATDDSTTRLRCPCGNWR
ncbi:MAG: hypothetical protein ACR2JB_08550 [Bryobacteraceae bacterium]